MKHRWAFFLLLIAAMGTAQGAEPRTARDSVGKPVQAAQQLLHQRKFKEALTALRRAEAVPGKTAYESYVIEETRAAADIGLDDAPAASKALRAVIASGMLPPAENLQRLAALVQLDDRMKDYPRLIEDAGRYIKAGGGDPTPPLLLAQAYYQQKDFADAAKTARLLLQANDKAGRKPDENLLLLLSSSDYALKDQAGYAATLERLVAVDPKKEYWTSLLAALRQKPDFSPRLALDLDRLMIATGTMTATAQYMDAAEEAIEDNLPAEAKSFLDKGYAAGLLGSGADADRQKRLATMAAQEAQDGTKALAAQAQAAGDGPALIKLGQVYASYGQYDKAIAAFEQGLRKGGLAHPEDAKLALGLAYLFAGQTPKAKETLSAVGGTDGARDLARLWMIQAGIA